MNAKTKIFVCWTIYLLCCRDKMTDASQVVCFSDFSNENMMNPINEMVHIVVANDHALKNTLINCCICHHKLNLNLSIAPYMAKRSRY